MYMMNFVIYCLLGVCCCLVQFGASSPQYENNVDISVKNNKNKVSGCFHNNTMFADTSIVPSSEPCLVCKCSKRNLVCVRRVCKDQPYPPPRGCILVQKKSQCCPYLSCSKYHVNFYKNSQHREHTYNNYQITHEKTLEKHYRTDDDNDEHQQHDDIKGGCIESGSLYASGSAMYRSSASLCSFCYCINGQQKCIKPKCTLKNTKCKPIFMEASCCPIKYDCSHNSTTAQTSKSEKVDLNAVNIDGKIKNRSNVCIENDRSYQEGERFPLKDDRPCEVCYCIKGIRKCVVKKCAPVIHGCVPKVPAHGACCPTSYDCRRRSLKFKRHSRQENQEEEEEDIEEDGDTIDFFSLLFGSDDIKTETTSVAPITSTISTTTLPPFKVLPSTTESSFFDLLRAGLEIIDANAEKIDAEINKVATEIPSTTLSKTSENLILTSTEMPKTTLTISSPPPSPSSSSLVFISTTTPRISTSTPVKMSSTTLSALKAQLSTTVKTTTKKPMTTTRKTTRTSTTIASITSSSSSAASTEKQTISTSTKSAKTTAKIIDTTTSTPEKKPTSSTNTRTTSTKRPSPPAPPSTIAPQKFIVPSLVETLQQQRLPSIVHFDVDKKYTPDDADNEADTLPNLEIIPFVAHDAIRTDKYEPYLSQPYDHHVVGGGGSVKEKPFRYNNKFIHHNYDDSLDYVYTNPHERIDNGPYYYENQFESFSPPNEQDFLGGFSPKETIYDEVSTSAKLPSPSSVLPQSNPNELFNKVKNVQSHEHKSSTADKNAAALTINHPTIAATKNQMSDGNEEKKKVQQQLSSTTEAITITKSTSTTPIPNFKKISSNFTSFINDLLQANTLDETKAPIVLSTPRSIKSTTTPKSTSSLAPVKSIINDDDFIKKHLKATSTSTSISKSSHQQQHHKKQQMEIFSKPTNPTMNGLLKLAGCNIYGQMYEVGHVIPELSSPCLQCKCLPDIGVGCMQLKC